MAPRRTVARIVALIRDTSSSLPEDAERALRRALRREEKGSGASTVLSTILKNVKLARANGTPLCQDIGTLTFFVDERLRAKMTPESIGEAVAKATELGLLRRNTIDPVTGASIDSNVCDGAPVIHYIPPRQFPISDSQSPISSPSISATIPRIALIMKGGGSENMSR